MASPTKTEVLHGLNRLSIARAKKSVENLSSWEQARDHARGRIKELKESVRVFEEKIKRGEPWPGSQSATPLHASEEAPTQN
jgi:hypothetical protein